MPTPSPPRTTAARGKRADALRNERTLLSAAATVFVRSGVDAPIREIASAAGVGIGTIYRHFPTRADLIVAVYRHQVEACADAGPELLATLDSPLAALRRWVEKFVDFLVTKHGLAAALRPDSARFAALHAYFLDRLVPVCAQLLAAAEDAGETRPGTDALELMRGIGNLCVGRDDRYDPRRLVDLLLRGLTVDEPDRARSPGRPGITESRLWAVRSGPACWNPAAPGPDAEAIAAFHRSIPGYRPTPLVALPAIAARLGVRSVVVKDESDRFGLPAFKVLGASWAINRAVGARLDRPPAVTFAELVDRARGSGLTLVTATDGNHGRAVARIAALLGLAAQVHVPTGLAADAILAIEDEGATVVRTGLVYDAAVRAAAAAADRPDALLVQDTAWPGYEDVPAWIVHGYATLFGEIDVQHPDRPDLVVVPTGVGSLLQAAIEHYRAREHRPALLAVEPETAACVTRSLRADAPVTVDTAAPTVMTGLNCGTVSSLAWPAIRTGLDAAVGVTDAEALAALEVLHGLGVAAGPCGAAALAGLDAAAARAPRLLDRDTAVVLISTESG